MAIKYSRLADNEHSIPFDYIRWVKSQLPVSFLKQQIVLVAIISSSLLLLIVSRFFTSNVEYELIRDVSHEINYSVIVDCGSSGTRAHIFTWKHGSQGVTDIDLFRDNQDKPYNKHIEPGLSSFKDDPDKASDYMEPIMNFVSGSIPPDRHIDTPIYFMATAGMRLLDDSTQKMILSDITRDLKAKYNFPRIKTQVISGEYEGVYSWLSINKDRFYNSSESDGRKSIGMIELGGASTQVAFEINQEIEQALLKNLASNDAISAFQNEQIKLDLFNNKSVTLFASTFLGLGVNSARESAIDILARDYLNGTGQLGEVITDLSKFQLHLEDPCLTKGSSELVIRPAEVISSVDQSVGFSIKQQDRAFKITLEGKGDFLMCLTLLERVIKAIKSERLNCSLSKKACPMDLLGHNFIPYQQLSFVGLSEMFFTTNEMMHSAGLFNRKHVLEETNRICGTHYSKLQELYSHGVISHDDRVLYECFKATWLLTILHSSGFRMPQTYDNFRTVDRLNGQEIDWTIGAMLWELDLNRVQIN